MTLDKSLRHYFSYCILRAYTLSGIQTCFGMRPACYTWTLSFIELISRILDLTPHIDVIEYSFRKLLISSKIRISVARNSMEARVSECTRKPHR
jgi:hypothetical protein